MGWEHDGSLGPLGWEESVIMTASVVGSAGTHIRPTLAPFDTTSHHRKEERIPKLQRLLRGPFGAGAPVADWRSWLASVKHERDENVVDRSFEGAPPSEAGVAVGDEQRVGHGVRHEAEHGVGRFGLTPGSEPRSEEQHGRGSGAADAGLAVNETRPAHVVHDGGEGEHALHVFFRRAQGIGGDDGVVEFEFEESLGQERPSGQGLSRVPDGYHGGDASGFFLSVDDTNGASAGTHAQTWKSIGILGVPAHAAILGWGPTGVKEL